MAAHGRRPERGRIVLEAPRRLSTGRLRLELALRELLAQDLLVELADARLRDLLDEGELVRHPPLRDQRRRGARAAPPASRLAPSLEHDAGQRPLGPALVGLRDHRRLEHVRVRHQRVLELDRGDPLAAGLDQVLGAVGDPHEALRSRSRRCRRCAASRRGTSRRRTGRRSSRRRSRGRGPRPRRSTRRPRAPRRRRRRSSRTSTQRHDAARRGPVAPVLLALDAPAGGRATAPSGLVSVMPQRLHDPHAVALLEARASATRAPPRRRRSRAAGSRGRACSRRRSAAGPSRSSARAPATVTRSRLDQLRRAARA